MCQHFFIRFGFGTWNNKTETILGLHTRTGGTHVSYLSSENKNKCTELNHAEKLSNANSSIFCKFSFHTPFQVLKILKIYFFGSIWNFAIFLFFHFFEFWKIKILEKFEFQVLLQLWNIFPRLQSFKIFQTIFFFDWKVAKSTSRWPKLEMCIS